MPNDTDPMAQIRASFFIECSELLESLQDSLEEMNRGDATDETINVVFRAVHSIKGGAGAFGLDRLVDFAHRYETVLDAVRAGKLTPDEHAVSVFFTAADTLSDLVEHCQMDTDLPEAGVELAVEALNALLGDDAGKEEEVDAGDFEVMALSLDLPGGGGDGSGGLPDLSDPSDLAALSYDDPGEDAASAAAASVEDGGVQDPTLPTDSAEAEDTPQYRIDFRPLPELFLSGNEPLFILRSLLKLGKGTVTCRTDDVAELALYDSESFKLSWTVDLVTEAGQDAITELFDFVADLCHLEITHTGFGSAQDEMAVPDQTPAPDVAEETSRTDTSEDDLAPLSALKLSVLEPAETPEAETVAPLAEATPAVAGQPAEPMLEAGPSVLPKPVPDAAGAPGVETKAPKAAAAQPMATVRVDLEKIDRLVNLVGELVINQAMLSQSVAEAGLPPNSPVAQGLEEFMRLTRDVQDSVMLIRAQPVKSLFQRMSRIVREASAAVAKDVQLITIGETTEVDKTVIERLADPLTHMVRNAVDHGLESTDDRLASGKSGKGTVTLTAAHRSGRVIIDVQDDGGGINRSKVQEIAVNKGLVPAGAVLSDQEIDNLLFMAGFSTADKVSNLSGRGVGMDVVKSSIQALGGRVTISSEKDVGTCFSISLPLTLAVLDGMVVDVAGETLVVPLNAIAETLTLTSEIVRPLGRDGHVVEIRGGFAPLVDLGVELGYRAPLPDYTDTVVLLITLEDGRRSALVVDTIQDQRQVVIKGLNTGLGEIPGIAAATILGDGQIALILDPIDITRLRHASLGDTQLILKEAG